MKDQNTINSFCKVIDHETEKLRNLNIEINESLHDMKRSILNAKKKISTSKQSCKTKMTLMKSS